MIIEETNLAMTKGDTFSFIFEVKDFPDSFSEVTFSCKKTPYDSGYAFQKSLGNGITRLAESKAKYRVRIEPEDTENLPSRIYYYDLEGTLAGENSQDSIYTIMKGKLNVSYEITV
jgi:hypothetical protein